MGLFAPTPRDGVESTSSRVHGKWREGGYPKENGVVTKSEWMLRRPPQCPLQHPPSTSSPQAPPSYFLFPNLSCALMSLNFCTCCPFHPGCCIFCNEFQCVCLGGGHAGAGVGSHTNNNQLGILQFSSILTLPGDSMRFHRLRSQSHKTALCFRGQS